MAIYYTLITKSYDDFDYPWEYLYIM
jgi:hypothetical protein